MTKPSKPSGSPYKILYWMGAGVLVLLLGVVALAVLIKPQPRETADPARTLLWLYETGNKGGSGWLTVIEESPSRNSLAAVPFPAPESALQAYAGTGARKAQAQVAALLQRDLHHRVFMPLDVVAILIDAAEGIDVNGGRMGGPSAIAYIREGGAESGARRAAEVMLALAEAAQRGMNMGVSEGLSLARQVETDLDLMSIPDMMGRWNSYGTLEVARPAANEPQFVRQHLLPDPPPAPAK